MDKDRTSKPPFPVPDYDWDSLYEEVVKKYPNIIKRLGDDRMPRENIVDRMLEHHRAEMGLLEIAPEEEADYSAKDLMAIMDEREFHAEAIMFLEGFKKMQEKAMSL